MATAARRRAVGMLALWLLSAGCAPEPTEGKFDDRDVQLPDASGGGGGGDASVASGLSGQWAMVAEWSTCVKVVDELETRAWRLLRTRRPSWYCARC